MKARDRFLTERGFEVLRIPVSDVLAEPDEIAVALFTAPAMAADKPHVKNVVLVHGTWADAQVPIGVEKAGGASVTTPAWKTRPSWYLVAKEDQIIPPAAQRLMVGRAKATVVESTGSHAVFISHPEAAAALIEQAAEATLK